MSLLSTFQTLYAMYEGRVLPQLRQVRLDNAGIGSQYPYNRFNTLGMFLAIATPYFRTFLDIANRLNPHDKEVIDIVGTPVRMRRYFLLLILGAYLDKGSIAHEKAQFFKTILQLYKEVIDSTEQSMITVKEDYFVGPDHCNFVSRKGTYDILDRLCVVLREYSDIIWFGEHPTSFSARIRTTKDESCILVRSFQHMRKLYRDVCVIEHYLFTPQSIQITEFGGSLVRKPPPSQRSGVALLVGNTETSPEEIERISGELISKAVRAKNKFLSNLPVEPQCFLEKAAEAYCFEIIRLAEKIGYKSDWLAQTTAAARTTQDITRKYCGDNASALPAVYADICREACNYVGELLDFEFTLPSDKNLPEERKAHIEADAQFAVVCTEPNTTMHALRPKAERIRSLIEYGYNTPPTVVVPGNTIGKLVEGTPTHTESELNEQALRLSQECQFKDLVSKALAKLALLEGNPDLYPIIVRSSGFLEDSDTATGAGIYRSFPNLKNSKEVVIAVAKCALQNVRTEPEFYDYTTAIIQPYKKFIYGGVTMGIEPVTSDREWIICEASFAGPTGVTSGADVDIRARVSRHDFNVEVVDTVKDLICELELKAAFIKTAMSCIEIEEVFGWPADIEWGVLPSKAVMYLQMRPIMLAGGLGKSNIQHFLGKSHIVLHGVPSSPGTVMGTVTKKTDVAISHGYPMILVCDLLGPDRLDALLKVGGVVCEKGGVNSHVSINCRELGIPCITGAIGAKTILDEGKEIILFGTKGVVCSQKNDE